MSDIGWFKIQVCYNLSGSLSDDEELSEVEKIRLESEGEYISFEVGMAVFNLGDDMISQVNPKAFVPKGGTNKKYISEIVFNSGRVCYPNMKPEKVYEELIEWALNAEKILISNKG